MSRAPRSATAKRQWGTDDSQTPILHVDMDAFFVSVELLARPELRGKPVAVGGQERGVVSAASYEARVFGVNSAMPVAQAKRLCPGLIMIPSSHGLYSAVSTRIMGILGSFTPLLEQVSVDEAFLDVSGARKLWGMPTDIAHQLRGAIREQEGVPASVGIAATKHVAKIASAHAKPDGVLLIPAERTQDFLVTLPIGAIWGVGEKTLETLARHGITSVADVAALPSADLERVIGRVPGRKVWELAHGIDPRPVVTRREEKSIGKENTFFEPLTKREDVLREMLDQSHECARRLRRAGLAASTVVIKVRATDFSTITRSHTLAMPTDLAHEIHRVASSLLPELPRGGVRLIGVRVQGLTEPVGQYALDDDGRRERLERAQDAIGSKFGPGVARPATLLERRDTSAGDSPGED